MSDIQTLVLGAAAWCMAIPAVKIAGNGVASEPSDKFMNKSLAVAVGVGIAYSTTPLLSWIMGWETPNEKVRGIALVGELRHLRSAKFDDRSLQSACYIVSLGRPLVQLRRLMDLFICSFPTSTIKTPLSD